MSTTLSTLNNLSPVYSDNLKLTVSESTASSAFTYIFIITLNTTVIDTFRYFADPITFNAIIDLSPILSKYFTSEIYTPLGDVIESISDSIFTYSVAVTTYNASNQVVDTANTGNKYVFNGCEDVQDNFDIDDFIFQTGKTSNFLTNWNTNRMITINDKAYLNTIIGNYTTNVSAFSGIEVTRYQSDNTISSVEYNNTDNTNKRIINLDVSPDTINIINSNFLNSDTLYYTIKELNDRENVIMRINIIQKYKHTDYYSFLYMNKLGGIDFISAGVSPIEEIKIKKEILDHYETLKVYNISSTNEIIVLTELLTIDQFNYLYNLFTSPAVNVYYETILSSINITNRKIEKISKYPKSDMLRRVIEFEFNNKKYIQQF